MSVKSAFRERLERLYRNLPALSPAEVLEVSAKAGTDEIKKNYYRLAREFHPDRVFLGSDPELKEKITTVFDAVTKAYQLLKGVQESGGNMAHAAPAQADVREPEESILHEQFMRGIDEFRNGNYWGAAELFRFVTRRTPTHAKAWNYLARALTEISKRTKEAEEALLDALKLDSFNSDYHVDLGSLYLRAGLKLRAKSQFEKALKLNAGNDRAKQELEKSSEKRSSLSRAAFSSRSPVNNGRVCTAQQKTGEKCSFPPL